MSFISLYLLCVVLVFLSSFWYYMILMCVPRELNETVEENTKLRKQISDLMVQNQQQVSATSTYGNCRYFNVIVVAAQ